MPVRAGASTAGYAAQNQLTPAQLAVLNQVYDVDGFAGGYKVIYWEVRRRMGNVNAPSRRLVREYLSTKLEYQMAQTVAEPRAVVPLIPRIDPTTREPIPLGLVAADTFFLPASFHRGNYQMAPGARAAVARNAKTNVWRVCVLVADTLVKYIYCAPCRLRTSLDIDQARPHSETSRDALIEFRRRARVQANDPNLQIKRLMVDAGSEWHAACETWTTAENIEVVRTQGSKSASNSIAEVHVRIARRMFVHDFKAFQRRWESDQTPAAQRNYDFVDRCDAINERLNHRRVGVIKGFPLHAIQPNQSPSYRECLDRIVDAEKKCYGGRAIDEPIVGQMGPAVLAVNTYVRKVKRKTGGGTAKLS